jgi:hypothetical protein
MIYKTRFIMALGTCHMAMSGGPPRFHIDIHLVAEATEGGTLCKF